VEHLSPEAIEAFVMDMASTDAETVRLHVARCALCAGRLEREARFEMLLHAAAEATIEVASPARRPAAWLGWSKPLQAATAFLVLAAAALWVGDAWHPASPPPGAPQVSGVGEVGPTATTGEMAGPGWDAECPRDYGRGVRPWVPCLDVSTTRRTDPGGYSAQADSFHDGNEGVRRGSDDSSTAGPTTP
jgi:hypothetical protein